MKSTLAMDPIADVLAEWGRNLSAEARTSLSRPFTQQSPEVLPGQVGDTDRAFLPQRGGLQRNPRLLCRTCMLPHFARLFSFLKHPVLIWRRSLSKHRSSRVELCMSKCVKCIKKLAKWVMQMNQSGWTCAFCYDFHKATTGSASHRREEPQPPAWPSLELDTHTFQRRLASWCKNSGCHVHAP